MERKVAVFTGRGVYGLRLYAGNGVVLLSESGWGLPSPIRRQRAGDIFFARN